MLLEALADPDDQDVWVEFDKRYHPIIQAFGVRLGLSQSDAADIAQETLLCFVRDYRAGKYDRSRARLHSWIIGIAQHRAYDLFRKQGRRREKRGESAFDPVPDKHQLTQIWSEEFERARLREALAQLRAQTNINERTIEAFTRHVIHRQTPEVVASSLEMTVQAVYLAKHRCVGKLRTILSEVERIYQ